MRQWRRAAIGLGSNLGDRLGVLEKAAGRIASEFLEGAVSSRVFETPPWGIQDQPDFLNAVLVGETEWKPPALVNYLKLLEKDLGREAGPRFGPRLVDLDLLALGEEVWSSEGVEVPHPRLAEREFVLLPWSEVWPEWRHPVEGRSVTELLQALRRIESSRARAVAPPLLDRGSL